MNIYIIAQYLNLDGQVEDRFFKLGREWVSRGHKVTVFTVNRAMDLDLGKKKIGLLQKGGLNTITFNVPHDPQMNGWQKVAAYLKFARMIGKQGRRLPRPDVIIAASPPLTAALPAMKLSKYYQSPLVMEIRELWPGGPPERDSLHSRLAFKAVRHLEQRVYGKTDHIIAGSRKIAGAVKDRLLKQREVTVIEEGKDDRELLEIYESVFNALDIKR